MFRSLRSRLTFSHALVFAMILLALGWVLQLVLDRNLDGSATNELLTAARGQASRIERSAEIQPPFDSDVPSAASLQMAVFAEPGDVYVGEPSEALAWLKHYPAETTDLTVSGERVRVVAVPAVVDGRTVAWVVAGRSLAAEDALVHRVRSLLLVGSALAILVSLAAGWWLAGRAVRPVERAYEAQAGFAADASHELRTPLTFIRSGVEVLAERDPDLGRDVLSEVDYLTGLTQRLLLLARAERGGVTLERVPVDVAEICRSAARRSEGAHATSLSLVGPDSLVATGDRVGTEAALDAVLENVKIHGGGAAELRWTPNGTEAVLSVADHGPGLDPEAADRAFERFFRADPSRTRDTGGAGLGLALARAMVEAEGGRMWVEPTPGGGLTAFVALPLA
ncbi:MAG: HAMP domain-containing sensor histidine kinase [Actinomycetota bacterium]